MFAASPGLHAVEHPIYDVWLTDCKGGSKVAGADTDNPPPQAGTQVPAPRAPAQAPAQQSAPPAQQRLAPPPPRR
jgi:hypothetical protein